MGWKGTIRSISASVNRYRREAERRERAIIREEQRRGRLIDREQKQLEKQLINEEKEFQQLTMLLSSQEEVDDYEEYIDKIQSMHKDVNYNLDWQQIALLKPPYKPTPITKNTQIARERYNQFKPNIFHKIFKLTEKAKFKLEQALLVAQKKDLEETLNAQKQYESNYKNWNNRVNHANLVLNFDEEVIQSHIDNFNILDKVPELGSSIDVEMNDNHEMIIDILLHSQDIIPRETKTLLKSGKLSIKDMPKTKYYELHQDYVCSAVLRVAREIFGLLPINKIIITASDELLDKATGHLSIQPILSVLIPRETINKLNFHSLDPSEAMNNFIHNMSFKKTIGFTSIKRLTF